MGQVIKQGEGYRVELVSLALRCGRSLGMYRLSFWIAFMNAGLTIAWKTFRWILYAFTPYLRLQYVLDLRFGHDLDGQLSEGEGHCKKSTLLRGERLDRLDRLSSSKTPCQEGTQR